MVKSFRYGSGKNVTPIMSDNLILELCSEEFNSSGSDQIKFINVYDVKSQC